MYNKILLPTDGQAISEKSLKHAAFIAEASNAEIIIVSVAETSFASGLPVAENLSEIIGALTVMAEDNVKKAEQEIKESYSDIKVKTQVYEGVPADIILKIIDEEDIDLVVFGNSQKSGFQKFLIGSVSDKVIRSNKSSVLFIK
ncbi:universal stress protein [Methanobrevibacter filiformis]|uniref:TRAP-T-associated universal stress protein TeaD n=1 Tax=Methanobrevibacter filiformis TaxID=55758 RepID=A0A165Z5H2_9EURY|nr:universal stress protein [Methanobrevibacter filiformis]KZX10272.1 TRAP-T-associated universal stress protein TeaD [Methanobrevibacter filiformis]